MLNGVELGGGSVRIHNRSLQELVFEKVLCLNNYKESFGHLLTALGMGCPPHSGMAIGFDRLLALLFNQQSIREVIAFPKNTQGIDPMCKVSIIDT